jgi:hypothetical protein
VPAIGTVPAKDPDAIDQFALRHDALKNQHQLTTKQHKNSIKTLKSLHTTETKALQE